MVGYYSGRNPHLLAMDPITVKEIMIKNFTHFNNNAVGDMMTLKSEEIVGLNPFFQKSVEWKETRKELVPGFTINRIKTYYPIIKSVCANFRKYTEKKCQEKKEVDIDDVSININILMINFTLIALQCLLQSNQFPIMRSITR